MGICLKSNYNKNLLKKEEYGELDSNENKIVKQIKYCICKIKNNNIKDYNIKYGIGFLCKIPFPDESQLLPVLIASNYIIEKDIIEGNIIEFSLYKNIFKIQFDNNRKTYINDKYKITFIEILENDGLNDKNFLKIDNKIHKKTKKEINKLYYINYQNKELNYFNGIINDFNIMGKIDSFNISDLGAPQI